MRRDECSAHPRTDAERFVHARTARARMRANARRARIRARTTRDAARCADAACRWISKERGNDPQCAKARARRPDAAAEVGCARCAQSKPRGVAAVSLKSGLRGEAAGGIGWAALPDSHRAGREAVDTAGSEDCVCCVCCELSLRIVLPGRASAVSERASVFRNAFVACAGRRQLAIASLRNGTAETTAARAASALAAAAALR